MQILVLINGQQNGPYSPEEVRQYLSTGQLQPQMLAWCEGMSDWQPLETFPEFAPPGAGTGSRVGRSRAWLYASLAVAVVAVCAVAGWLLWHGKKSKATVATVAPPAESTAPAPQAPIAGHADWPKTLAELNEWYVEPPAGQNAAQVFLQGFDVMSAQMKAHSYGNDANLPVMGKAAVPSLGSPVPAKTKTAIAAFMQQNQPAWDLFKQGSSLTQSRYPLDLTQGANLLLPHLAQVKQGAQAAEIYALGFADTHQAKEAGESLLVAYALSRSLDAEPLLISQLVRIACNAISLRSLEQTVNRVALPPQTLTQLQEALGRMADREASGESLNRAFVGEELNGLVRFDMSPEELKKDLDSSFGNMTPEEIQKALQSSFGTNLPNDTNAFISNLQKYILKNLKADRQFYVSNWDQVFAARKEPFPSRLTAQNLAGLPMSEAQRQQFLLSSMLVPAIGKSTPTEARDLAGLRLAQTAVALERFRAASANRYPDDLAALSPKFLASVPQDPFDGQPLRYTKSGNGYNLHSIGPANATDAQQKALTFAVSNPPKPASP
ncbi:MAG: DUF4339 domain-containing protein [Verrucomicrobiota bacterium]|jgi:hypothetical protein